MGCFSSSPVKAPYNVESVVGIWTADGGTREETQVLGLDSLGNMEWTKASFPTRTTVRGPCTKWVVENNGGLIEVHMQKNVCSKALVIELQKPFKEGDHWYMRVNGVKFKRSSGGEPRTVAAGGVDLEHGQPASPMGGGSIKFAAHGSSGNPVGPPPDGVDL
jgi:hypothetical protein